MIGILVVRLIGLVKWAVHGSGSSQDDREEQRSGRPIKGQDLLRGGRRGKGGKWKKRGEEGGLRG